MRRSTTKKLLATFAILAAVGAFMSFGVFSLFSTTQANTSQLTTASFDFAQLPTAGNLFGTLTGLLPGDFIPRCVQLTYTGTAPATVTATPSIPDASNLSHDPTMTIQQVTGVKTDTTSNLQNCVPDTGGITNVGTALVNNVAASSLAAVTLPPDTGSTWANPESHIYEITVRLPTTLTLADISQSINPAVSFVATQVAGSQK